MQITSNVITINDQRKMNNLLYRYSDSGLQRPSLYNNQHGIDVHCSKIDPSQNKLIKGRRLEQLNLQLDQSVSWKNAHNDAKSINMSKCETIIYNSKDLFNTNTIPLDELKQINFIRFPNPYNVVQLKRLISFGKYGKIALVESFKSNHYHHHQLRGQQREQQHDKDLLNPTQTTYVVKFITNSLSYNRESEAYKHMSKCWSLTNQTGPNTIHPFISSLLSKTVIHVKPLHPDQELKSTGCINQLTKLNSVKFKTFYLLLFDLAIGSDLNKLAFHYLNKNMPLNEAIFYVAEITEVLIWLHHIGIVHQDLKPDNVLIGHDGHIRLTDFGLAHVLPDGPGSKFFSNIISSSEHMPPEIASFPVGTTLIWHAVDWYSLGILFHQLLHCKSSLAKFTGNNLISTCPHIPNWAHDCQCLVRHLLSHNPCTRLGSDPVWGGNFILSHPGFIHSLLYSPNETVHSKSVMETCHTMNFVVSELDSNLKRDMLTSLHEFTNGNAQINWTNQIGPCGTSENRKLPHWIPHLRWAIRNRSLVPPYKPMISDTNFEPFLRSE